MYTTLYLAHHGVKGQKHGIRQYQNPDGSLTPLGRAHYGVGDKKSSVQVNTLSERRSNKIRKRINQLESNARNSSRAKEDYGEKSSQYKRARYKTAKSANKYMQVIKDPAYTKWRNSTLIATALVGPIGNVIYTTATKKGRETVNAYAKRLNNVIDTAEIAAAIETKYGREHMISAFEEAGIHKQRADRY